MRIHTSLLGAIVAIGLCAYAYPAASFAPPLVLVGETGVECSAPHKESNKKLPAGNGAFAVWLKIDPLLYPTDPIQYPDTFGLPPFVANMDRLVGNTFVPVATGQVVLLVPCAAPEEKWRVNAIAYAGFPAGTYRLRLFDPAGVLLDEDFFKLG